MTKHSDSKTLKRKIRMLDLLPDGAQGAMRASELHDKLRAEDFVVDRRTVERDLEQLLGLFAVQRREGKPAGWCWRPSRKPPQLLGMDDETALTYSMLERFLTPLLPQPLLAKLVPQFARARDKLASGARAPVKAWNRRIAVAPDTQPLRAPRVPQSTLGVVSRALLDSCQCEFDYRSADAADAAKPKHHCVDPYGLVMQGRRLYLVASRDGGKPYTYALHRMRAPVLADTRAHVPPDFDAETYAVGEHGLDIRHGRPIHLELIVSSWWARYLGECKLASDQVILATRDRDQMRVRATVDDTEQLRWWLLSLGPDIEVRKPKALRERMASDIRAMARRYKR